MERCITHGEPLLNCPTCTEEVIQREREKLAREIEELMGGNPDALVSGAYLLLVARGGR